MKGQIVMINETYHNPTKVYFGRGVIAELPALLKKSVKKKALLVYGSNT